VAKVRSHVKPWRMSVCLSAHSILELPSGTIRDSRTLRGDKLEISGNPDLVPKPDSPA
jgi:uncharacterized membrane protein (UPF0127 family)